MVLESITQFLIGYADILYAVWVLALTFLVSKSLFYIFKHYILEIRHKGDSNKFHEHLAEEVKIPFYLIVWTVGIYMALSQILLIREYSEGLKDMFVVVAVLLGVYITRKAINGIITWYSSKDRRALKIERTALLSLKNLISIFIYIIAIIIILGQFGVEITPLIASLGIGGLAIALALQPTLSNYFSSMYIASDQTIRLGDFIELDEEKRGYVEKMTWRTVWIRTVTNNMVVIPNSKLADTTITNYSQPKRSLLVWVDVGVAYASDLKEVEKISIAVAKKVCKELDCLAENEEPFVRFREFGDSNIKFRVLFKIKSWDYRYQLTHDFIKELKSVYDKKGIEISFPCRNIYERE